MWSTSLTPIIAYSVMLTTVACYTIQLYADFAGYTNIALGVGKLFGVEGPPNFNAPFAAVNIQEMWRRWHMSLTSWLTDYLFTPMSMALRDYGRPGLIAAVCINMIIIGVWHGFTLNYFVFGVLHAVFLTVTVLILGARARRKRAAGKTKAADGDALRPPRAVVGFLGAVLTFALMSFSQIFFHSSTWAELLLAILRQVLAALRQAGPPAGPTCRRTSSFPHSFAWPSPFSSARGRPARGGSCSRSAGSRRSGCSTALACSCSLSSQPRRADNSSMGSFSRRSRGGARLS